MNRNLVTVRVAALIAAFGLVLLSAVTASAGSSVPADTIGRPGAGLHEGYMAGAGNLPVNLRSNIDPTLPSETEPNNAPATATPLNLINGGARIQGNTHPIGDQDYFSFAATAGDRVYAAVMTAFSVLDDSHLRLFAADGITEIEFDDNDGSFSNTSSSIAGATIPSSGTYYLRVNHATGSYLTPYMLYFRRQRGAPIAEVEPNNNTATPNALPSSGFVSGDIGADGDFFSFTANAGDTVFLSLDLDPERDNVQTDARVGLGLFGDSNANVLSVKGADVGSATNPLSEAMFFSIRTAGTYFVRIDSAVLNASNTYHLSVTVYPQPAPLGVCNTYSSTDVPKTIGPEPGLVSSTITVPGNPRIADLDVRIELDHAEMNNVDVVLRSPAGNENSIFTDIVNNAPVSQDRLDIEFDDEAAVPPFFQRFRPMRLQPEQEYRLGWFDGENAGGTWTLDVYDDTPNDGGTLTGWSLLVCEPPPPPTCPPGYAMHTVYGTDFEANDGGFTHSGTADEWERGLPSFALITTCNSGSNCWKTDLDGSPDLIGDQNLNSPSVSLAGMRAPVLVQWAQRYQLLDRLVDAYTVSIEPLAAPTNSLTLFEWLGNVMFDRVGPGINIQQSAGWGLFSAQADAFAGQDVRLRFHFDSSTSFPRSGVAIDDVSISACRAALADLTITNSDGVATAAPGGSTTYTITASNIGPADISGATLVDNFPVACASVNWSCASGGGASCTASGVGNINDNVDLPVGGSVIYSATCNITPAAVGSLVNTATVTAPAGVSDPTPANNSATDTDSLTPQASLRITKSDGVNTIQAGGTLVYTIAASNTGPSNAPGSIIADTWPAQCNAPVLWTCAGVGGATCTAAGTGNINDVANLPISSAVTYTGTCVVAAATPGGTVISNTATVAATAGIVDTNPGDNRATDSTTVQLRADLAVTKTDGAASAVPGTNTTYTIIVSNAGPDAVMDATVADSFPAACISINWTCLGAGGGTCSASGAGNINDTANLPVGGSVTYSGTCAIDPSATGSMSNTATVSSAIADPMTSNNSATDTDTLVPRTDLSITKTDGVATISADGTLTYMIVASNASGPSNAVGSTVTDVWPAQCAAPVNWTCVGAGAGTCTASGSGNVNDTVNLPVGGSVSYTGTCQVTAGVAGGTVINNTATVAVAPGGTDPTPGNNSANDTTTVLSPANVLGTKTVSAPSGGFAPGASVIYRVVLNNTGAGVQSDNTGDEFVDVLPEQLTLVSATASSGSAVATLSTNTVTWNGSISASGSVTITIGATINADASGTVNNQGTIHYDNTGIGTNNASRLTDNPLLPGAADPTGFSILLAVPALNRVGLVLLVLMTLMLATRGLRTR